MWGDELIQQREMVGMVMFENGNIVWKKQYLQAQDGIIECISDYTYMKRDLIYPKSSFFFLWLS